MARRRTESTAPATAPAGQSASQRGDGSGTGGVMSWIDHHRLAMSETLDRLLHSPTNALMTIAALAIALALPALLYTVLNNLQRLGGDWEGGAALSLFLKPGIGVEQSAALAQRIQQRRDLDSVQLITPDQGLAEFREYSGLGGALDQLSENPLPVVLALYPNPAYKTPRALQVLSVELGAEPETDFVRIDVQWIQRFAAIIYLLRQAVTLLGVVLALGVLLVVGNTIRLEIESRRQEIEIMDLVGATPGFIRRPFLYSGAWYGLLGGILAWATVAAAIQLLQSPVTELADLYNVDLRLHGLGPAETLFLLGTSTLLGILGAWIAAGRHLRKNRML